MRLMQFFVDCPWPPISGADIRNTLLSCHEGISAYCGVGLTQPRQATSKISVDYHALPCFSGTNPWRNYRSELPICLRFPQRAAYEVDQLLDEFQPTVVVLEGVAWGDILRQLKDRRVPTVLDMHNVESRIYQERIKSRTWFKRLLANSLGRRCLAAVKEADRELSRMADQTWVCSSMDESELRALGGASHHLIPNPIPDEKLLATSIYEDRYRNPVPLFIGHLSYFPNVAAVAEIGHELVPALAQKEVKVRPIVAGRAPSRTIRNLASRGLIQLEADPVSCAKLLTQSGYSLLPIRHGSGTRIKVLEALAAGVVVIATYKAVEGLGLIDGIHYCHAETITDMCEILCELVASPNRALKLAERGRLFVVEHHSHAALQQKIENALQCFRTAHQSCVGQAQ